MYKAILAIYDNGKIFPIDNEKITVKKGKVLLTFLDDAEISEIPAITTQEILKFKGTLKSFPEDSLQFQREIRNEW
ncbi:MAG: hypothetical protein PHW04_09570 [Candidatus Wallbacteria bacterium]|nr:hypothetical protein [Candidatus Wallbacteria bacterium]